MAGSGKSSLGRKIASRLGCEFIDSDRVIEATYATNLQLILDDKGQDKFKAIEEEIILSIQFNQTILATGGSVVLSHKAMNHLKKFSEIFYLEVSYKNILKRISDFETRGFIKDPNQTFEQAYKERKAIYSKYADHIVGNNETADEAINKILSIMNN